MRRATHRDWVEPMLATLTERRGLDDGWVYERKFDGIRALAFRGRSGVRMLSRNRLDLTGSYPGVVEALAQLDADRFVLDGEVVAFHGRRTGFEVLQQARRLRETGRGNVRVVYQAFDVLRIGRRDLRPLPLLERKRELRALAPARGVVRVERHRSGDAGGLLERACVDGWEGLIAKRADAPYTGGRSRDWLKLKCSLEQEFVVAGFTDPKGSRVGFGALLLGYQHDGELRFAGEVGTGFDRAELEELTALLRPLERDDSPFADQRRAKKGWHWADPRLVVQVAFTEWTRDGRLRHPRYLGLREDKPPREVVREQPER